MANLCWYLSFSNFYKSADFLENLYVTEIPLQNCFLHWAECITL